MNNALNFLLMFVFIGSCYFVIDFIKNNTLQGHLIYDNNIEPFYIKSTYTSKKDEVSIVTHLTIDRIDSLIYMAKRWKGPITSVIFVKDYRKEITKIKTIIKEKYELNAILKKYVDIHLYVAEPFNKVYQANTLRNIGMYYAPTRYIIMLDVDFIGDVNMRANINRDIVPIYKSIKNQEPNFVFVIPSFEIIYHQIKPPETKEEMVHLYLQGFSNQVHELKERIAHQSTQYNKWAKIIIDEEKLSDQPCVEYPKKNQVLRNDINYCYFETEYSYMFEPYVVIDKTYSPKYSELFQGYGNDKTSYTYELMAKKTKFYVYLKSFLVHLHHDDADWNQKLSQSQDLSFIRWTHFIELVNTKYNIDYHPPEWFITLCKSNTCELNPDWIINE